MNVLLIGGGAREHALGEALCRSSDIRLLTVSHNHNPGLAALSQAVLHHDERDVKYICRWAQEHAVELAVIGLEDPLDAALPDRLAEVGIPTVGPRECGARLETSKPFLRSLMSEYRIPGQITSWYFSDSDAVAAFLRKSSAQYALKPIGLTAGKGVKVMGEQLASTEEAIQYARAIIELGIGGEHALLLEERAHGEEFTLQCFVDGDTLVPMPLVQDYKRAHEGDTGPNTGSMGSYSQADGLLPFVSAAERDEAVDILRAIVRAVADKGCQYQGIIYGQFMMTASGIKLIEINARFGDPEAANVLPLLRSDFGQICRAIVSSCLNTVPVEFARKATVCKYVTPPGYGVSPRVNVPLHVDLQAIESLGVRVFFAKVDQRDGTFFTTSSRSIALVGVGDSVDEAEVAVERALDFVHGEYHVRHDIGKRELRDRWLRPGHPLRPHSSVR